MLSWVFDIRLIENATFNKCICINSFLYDNLKKNHNLNTAQSVKLDQIRPRCEVNVRDNLSKIQIDLSIWFIYHSIQEN